MPIFEHQTTHRVSAKVALYSHDYSQVLVMVYAGGVAEGLPGGHLENHESPDQAIAREFMEELGVEIPPVERKNFFRRETTEGPVILGYAGIAPAEFEMKPTHPEHEIAEWRTRAEVESSKMADEYKAFVIENWPN